MTTILATSRRPRMIYLIALWYWFSWGLNIDTIFRRYNETSIARGEGASPLFTLAGALFIVELVGLIQLRRWALWIFSGFLMLWSIVLLYISVSRQGRLGMLALIICMVNIAVVSYIMSPGFRRARAQFRKEEDQQSVERHALKQIRKTVPMMPKTAGAQAGRNSREREDDRGFVFLS